MARCHLLAQKDIGPYVIMGVCNPMLGHGVLEADPNAGVAVPCQMFIRKSGDDFVVGMVDPSKSLAAHTDDPTVLAVATEASGLIKGVLDSLAASSA
jgi:uncharacterized protein (DUF302 family)